MHMAVASCVFIDSSRVHATGLLADSFRNLPPASNLLL
jgi:hypothetical protein